jgi:hypothetical protein
MYIIITVRKWNLYLNWKQKIDSNWEEIKKDRLSESYNDHTEILSIDYLDTWDEWAV